MADEIEIHKLVVNNLFEFDDKGFIVKMNYYPGLDVLEEYRAMLMRAPSYYRDQSIEYIKNINTLEFIISYLKGKENILDLLTDIQRIIEK